MSRFFVVLVAILASASAKHQKLSVIAQDSSAQSTGEEISAIEFSGDYSAHGGKKYSTGSELTSLAYSSALQAKTAVRNQQSAGIQAALGAQTGYARAALEAASAAQVAVVAKRVVYQNLERYAQETARQLQVEEVQYQQTLQVANAAQNAAAQSQQQLAAATAAFTAVQQATTQTQKAAAAAAQTAAAQHQMIEDAKQRLGLLYDRLQNALAELQQTEAVAQKAVAAAQIAQSNAAASAQLAAVNSASNQVEEHEGSGYHH